MFYSQKELCADKTKMSLARINVGKQAEDLAVSYLKKHGYTIIEKNYKTRLGEVDIIANDKDCVCFIEVRSLNTKRFDLPEYSITNKKQNQIAKTALSYIKRYGMKDKDSRFDIVCIEDIDSREPVIRLLKNAFELDSWYKY